MVSLNPSRYKQTLIASIILQLISGIISVYALTLTIPKEFEYLYSLVSLDAVVQFIELIYYLFFLIFTVSATTASKIRYYDWVITTPVMVFTTIAYFYFSFTTEKAREDTKNNKYEHLKLKHRLFSRAGEKPDSSLWNTIKTQYQHMKEFATLPQHSMSIVGILLANFFMLLAGYWGETNILSRFNATLVGFLFFFIEFWLIYNDFVLPYKSPSNVFYFWVFFVVWALYGVAYMFNHTTKNVIYNGLDVISKNMYGVLLSYGIYSLASSS